MSPTRQCRYPGCTQWGWYSLETFKSMICNELFSVISHGHSTLTLLPTVVFCGVEAGVGLKGGSVTYLHQVFITGRNHSH